ncbi:hypothetical protein C8R45DRAFT_11009 [Mycena sanguinolenta]|nr:hypothetical protein C8R45DRAFT_11009 [Mycena sanguinolenta]
MSRRAASCFEDSTNVFYLHPMSGHISIAFCRSDSSPARRLHSSIFKPDRLLRRLDFFSVSVFPHLCAAQPPTIGFKYIPECRYSTAGLMGYIYICNDWETASSATVRRGDGKGSRPCGRCPGHVQRRVGGAYPRPESAHSSWCACARSSTKCCRQR